MRKSPRSLPKRFLENSRKLWWWRISRFGWDHTSFFYFVLRICKSAVVCAYYGGVSWVGLTCKGKDTSCGSMTILCAVVGVGDESQWTPETTLESLIHDFFPLTEYSPRQCELCVLHFPCKLFSNLDDLLYFLGYLIVKGYTDYERTNIGTSLPEDTAADTSVDDFGESLDEMNVTPPGAEGGTRHKPRTARECWPNFKIRYVNYGEVIVSNINLMAILLLSLQRSNFIGSWKSQGLFKWCQSAL